MLVHDMGPNWELVSDIMNDILQFKVIVLKALFSFYWICYHAYFKFLLLADGTKLIT